MFSSQSQMASGLMRFRSAPSSFLETLVGGTGDEFHNLSPVPPENLMGRFFSGDSSCLTSESSCRVAVSTGPDLSEMEPSRSIPDLQYAPTSTNQDLKKREGFGTRGFSEPESLLQRVGSNGGGGGGGGGFSHLGHVGTSHFTTSSNDKSSLTRHSSSPAGFLSNLHLENGYSFGGEAGSFSLDNCSPGAAKRRLKSQLSFSGNHSPNGRRLMPPQLSEISSVAEVGESMAASGNSSSDDGSLGGAADTHKSFLSTGFPPATSWDDSQPIVFDAMGSRKRGRDLNGGDLIHGFPDLQQFGLSKASMEMVSMEKFLQIPQDSVPCKIRAKRGCATHPRSIAERERRTRSSEKLRKLQELVPNMDKQTNTADMLDLAVQYIKTLQNDAQKLAKERASCSCPSKKDARS